MRATKSRVIIVYDSRYGNLTSRNLRNHFSVGSADYIQIYVRFYRHLASI
jgi:hypothetical protein